MKKIYMLSCFLVSLTISDAQIWTNYTIANGLISNIVYAIAIDSHGNKWFGFGGVNGGVSKFDGTEWTNYTTVNSGLATNIINTIEIDSLGNKWIGFGYYGGGISKFDGLIWTNYTPGKSALPRNLSSITSITIDAIGNIWMGIRLKSGRSSKGAGVLKFDGSKWAKFNQKNSNLPNDNVNSIAIDHQGNIWFGTYNGVSKFDGNEWTNYTTANSGLINNTVNSIAIDSSGIKWIGCGDGIGNGGISKFDGTNWINYTSLNSGLVDNDVLSIAIDSKGYKWFGTKAGLSVLNDNYLPITIKKQPRNQKVIKGNTAYLSVSVTGTLPKFQWYKGSDPIVNSKDSVFIIPSTQLSDSGSIYCIVSNAVDTIKSNIIKLSIIDPF